MANLMSTELDELFAVLAQLDEVEEVPDGDYESEDEDDDQFEATLDADAAASVTTLPDQQLGHGELTLILHRYVMPTLEHLVTHQRYLTLGHLARATHRLQGSEWHLARVRQFVQRTRVPLFAARTSTGRNLQLAVIEQAKRYFGDLVHGEPELAHVIARLGYADVPLRDATRMFLLQAWMNHCLSHAEEQHLAEVVAEEVAQYGLVYQDWSAQARLAREQLVLDNLWLVTRIARKYLDSGLDIDDLLQVGQLGLLRAVEKQDPSRGNRFVTYASNWVFQSITRYLADHSSLIRLPVHLQEHRSKVEAIHDRLYSQIGRPPSLRAIADASETDEYIVRALLITSQTTSLDIRGRPAFTESRRVALNDDEEIDSRLLHQQIAAVLDTLTERERQVIQLRFGLIDGDTRTLEEVGQKFGVTRERIRQIEAKAIKRLRHPSRSKQLRPFIEDSLPSQMRVKPSPIDRGFLLLAAARFNTFHRAILTKLLDLDGSGPRSRQSVLEEYKVSPAEADALQAALYAAGERLRTDNPLAITTILLTHEDANGAKQIIERQLCLGMVPLETPFTSDSHAAILTATNTRKIVSSAHDRPLPLPSAASIVDSMIVPPLVREMQLRPSIAQVVTILPKLSRSEHAVAAYLYGVAGRPRKSASSIAHLLHMDIDAISKIDMLVRCFVLELRYKETVGTKSNDSNLTISALSTAMTSNLDEQATVFNLSQESCEQISVAHVASSIMSVGHTDSRSEMLTSTDEQSFRQDDPVTFTNDATLRSHKIEQEHEPNRSSDFASSVPEASTDHIAREQALPTFVTPRVHDLESLLAQLGIYDRLIADALFGFTTGVPMSVETTAREFGVPLDQVANVRAAMRFLLEAHSLIPDNAPPLMMSEAEVTVPESPRTDPVIDNAATVILSAPQSPIMSGPASDQARSVDPVADVLPVERIAQAATVYSRAHQALATFDLDEARILDALNGITSQTLGDNHAVADHFDVPLGYVQRLQWKFERRLSTLPAIPPVSSIAQPGIDIPIVQEIATASADNSSSSPQQPHASQQPRKNEDRANVEAATADDTPLGVSANGQEFDSRTLPTVSLMQTATKNSGGGYDSAKPESLAPINTTTNTVSLNARKAFRSLASSLQRRFSRQ